MSADTTVSTAINAASFAFPRLEQTFPTLSLHEIDRMRRFGEVRRYKHGERLFETGKPGRACSSSCPARWRSPSAMALAVSRR